MSEEELQSLDELEREASKNVGIYVAYVKVAPHDAVEARLWSEAVTSRIKYLERTKLCSKKT